MSFQSKVYAPRSRLISSRQSITLIILALIVILYSSIPNHYLQKQNLPTFSSLYSENSWTSSSSYHEQQQDSVADLISTRSAGELGTFVETSAFDLPKLIATKVKSPSSSSSKSMYLDDELDVDETLNGGTMNGVENLRIAVLEHAGFHEEVVGAVLKTMIDIGANFTLYRDSFRWGYDTVLSEGMNYTVKPTPYSDGTFAKAVDNKEIDVVIHISCDYGFFNWPKNKIAYESMKNNKDLELICMLHELEQLKDEEKRQWEKATNENRLTYLTLSKHVKTFLKSQVLKWSTMSHSLNWGKVDVEEFVPIFPVDPATLPDSEAVQVSQYFPKRADRIPSRLAILGNIKPWSRTYIPIMNDLQTALQVDPSIWGYLPLTKEEIESNSTYKSSNDPSRPPVTLHFIGKLVPSVKLDIPPSMKDMVFIHSDLAYTEFYRLLGSMDLILPAFVGWNYYEKKLSSAIPAGIVSKVPVLGSEILLNSYQFLRDPSIVLHASGLKEIEAIELLRKGINPYTYQPITKTITLGSSNSQTDPVSDVEIELTTTEVIKPLLPGKSIHNNENKRSSNSNKFKQLLLGLSSDDLDQVEEEEQGFSEELELDSDTLDMQEDWLEYHQNLYKANGEMFLNLFDRLSKKIESRKLSSN
ncbi:uncharacterized protein L201_007000 [Kwoniella dendrophila CBS 6074]|uniref:Glycosyltransferase family 1 protein n=1 Tax=Kwoniella dendrophila CBS 6074 TaxID=1295534 RepID=A0AAX4K379_9TREE